MVRCLSLAIGQWTLSRTCRFVMTGSGSMDVLTLATMVGLYGCPARASDSSAGHAGAMLQARQNGRQLVVGVHSDEEICEHKGPTVMNLAERSVDLQVLLSRKLMISSQHCSCRGMPVVYACRPRCAICHLSPLDIPLWLPVCGTWR